MSIHFNILIDASGSMGHFYDKDGNPNIKYLLPDGRTTRTELVIKILIDSVIPKLSFIDTIKIETFSSPVVLNQFGNPKLKSGQKQHSPKTLNIYEGEYSVEKIDTSINKITIPVEAGTPLSWATCVTINQSKQEKINIIILSDGDDSVTALYDEIILQTIGTKNCKIYFIGISQNEEAQRKSKNLADKTGGFYVNLGIMNYDETIFDNMLFEFNTIITSNALKDQFRIGSLVSETISNIIEVKNEPKTAEEEKEELNIAATVQKETKPIDIEKQVEENTKSLQLITSQLDSIVKQISFISKVKTNDEDEFEANEDEERNRVIGYQCEKHINSIFLKNNWQKVDWLNENTEQSKPYDFEITVSGINYFIECKGSTSNSKEFFLTKNEWLFYLANRKNYRLYFVSEINSQNPTIHRIEDLLTDMEEGKLIPCSSLNRKVKADRILFQIIN